MFYMFMFIYSFQIWTFVLISTREIFTICWIAFRAETSDRRETEGLSVAKTVITGDTRTWEPPVVSRWHRGLSDKWHNLQTNTGRETVKWRQWYDRNMETRLTRGRSQDSGMFCILQTKDSWYPEGGLCDFHKPVMVHLEICDSKVCRVLALFFWNGLSGDFLSSVPANDF